MLGFFGGNQMNARPKFSRQFIRSLPGADAAPPLIDEIGARQYTLRRSALEEQLP
jgi:hypothetical protein